MPTRCKLCTSNDQDLANKWIVEGRSDRRIAAHFKIAANSVKRHRAHVGKKLAAAIARREEKSEDFILEHTRRLLDHAELVWDACHRYLQDPQHPSRYDLGPRAGDLDVIYDEIIEGDQRTLTVRHKALLSVLLDRALKKNEELIEVRYRIADPRKLVLSAIDELRQLVDQQARFLGHTGATAGNNLSLSVSIYQLMPRIYRVLQQHPKVLEAVHKELEGGIGAVS